MTGRMSWERARVAAYEAAAPVATVRVPLDSADGYVLAEPLVASTDLPPFESASVDGYAVAGPGPWRLIGRVLAGGPAIRNSVGRVSAPNGPAASAPMRLAAGEAYEIATGARVPSGTEWLIRLEHTSRTGDVVSGPLPTRREWRPAGEEAHAGQILVPAGRRVTPAVIGLAAAAGADTMTVRRRPRVSVVVFGDELVSTGSPTGDRIRDALGPSLPAWLARYGAEVTSGASVRPTIDSLAAQWNALRRSAADPVDLIITTGGTMHGPVDHLRSALAELDAEYLVDTVAVRPGHPMLVARLPAGGPLLVGLPGNPQAAVAALVTLVEPVLAGMRGLPLPCLHRAVAAEPIAGRGENTRLAAVRLEPDGRAVTRTHTGPAMLRGVAFSDGFAIIRPGTDIEIGDEVEFAALPLARGERP